MDVDIDQMRRDFPLAARQRDWSPADCAEVSGLIRSAVDAGDKATLAYWATELAAGAADWLEFRASVRAAEERMRIAARLARQA